MINAPAEKKVPSKGLLPLVENGKDFHHAVVFGSLGVDQIPNTDFFVSHPLAIKNQGALQFCTSFATAAVVEDQVDIELDPLSAYAWACKLLGKVDPNGHQLRDACDEAIKIGFIEQSVAPFDISQPASFLADPANYNEDLLANAWEHARISYFRCDTGPHDVFDNIRAALFQNIDEHRSILTGCVWHDEWTDAPNGMIPETYASTTGEGHAVKIFGQINFPGEKEPRLIIQNSWGDGYGDKGLYYVTRTVVNKEFVAYGAFNFKDLAPQKAAFYAQNGITVDASNWTKFVATIIGIITSYF